jgi:positive regulator of sigma E activity
VAARASFFAEGRVREIASNGKQACVELLSDGAHTCFQAGGCAGCTRGGCACVPGQSPAGGGRAQAGTVLLADNAIAARPGERVVLFATRGLRFSASGLIFFFPLIIFFAAWAFGYALFKGRDLFAFGFAVLVVCLYYLLYHFWEKRHIKKDAPLIWIERVLKNNEHFSSYNGE